MEDASWCGVGEQLRARPFPRVTTRGYYDLETGEPLKRRRYFLYPAAAFDEMAGTPEMVVVIHGLRNDKAAAVEKFLACKQQLLALGYDSSIIGFSYDSNVRGAHLLGHEQRAIEVGRKIAQRCGWNLATFIADFKGRSPKTRVRLLGHSLGSEVAISTLQHLVGHDIAVESVHFFGASITVESFLSLHGTIRGAVRTGITNYYSPYDDVLLDAYNHGVVERPLGLYGLEDGPHLGYRQIQVRPATHQFVSYLGVLESFP